MPNNGSYLRRLEHITGLATALEEERATPPDEHPARWALYVPGGTIYSYLKKEKDACDQLRAKNWRRVKNIRFTETGWRCERCDAIKPLEGHHRIYRSRWRREDGPLDVAENVEALCNDCHAKEHRG